MSWERELRALQKKCRGDVRDFEKLIEPFIVNERLCRSSIFNIVESYEKQARLDGSDSFTICYIEPTLAHIEELLIIEDWAEDAGYEFDVEDTRTSGVKMVSITVNLSD